MTGLKVRNTEFGVGMPKVCVPIVGKTEEEILEQTRKIVEKNPDCIEFRGDWFEGVWDEKRLVSILGIIRSHIGDILLLFTFRSKNEGGQQDILVPEYVRLCELVCDSGNVDLLDVEAYMQEGILAKICEYAHAKGVKIIASNHDFEKTPATKEMIARLQYMDREGADIPKLAVMPQVERDVLDLLSATLSYHELGGDKPIITMSMKQMGMISRVAGALVGSVMTFATVGEASAPGQLPIEEVRLIMREIQK